MAPGKKRAKKAVPIRRAPVPEMDWVIASWVSNDVLTVTMLVLVGRDLGGSAHSVLGKGLRVLAVCELSSELGEAL